MQLASELLDADAWAAATDARRDAILGDVLASLPDFELAYVKTYPGREPLPEGDQLPDLPIATLRQRSSGVFFNLLPGGTFQMGFSERQANALRHIAAAEDMNEDEMSFVTDILTDPSQMRPLRTITIRPFLIARYPLSRFEAARLLGLDPDDEETPCIVDLDVAGFFEEDVDTFLATTGYRLPSEAEWEYACRAGSDTLFWWGDRLPLRRSNLRPEEMEWTEDVENEAAADRYSNPFGLVNLAAYPEICADLWHETLADIPSDGLPWTDASDRPEHVARGGGALSYPWQDVGEWLALLTAMRFITSEISEIGLAIRPVYPLS